MTTADLTDAEARMVELARAIKASWGYGDLRVEIRAGVETKFCPEFSEAWPPKNKKVLTNIKPSSTI